MGRFGFAAILVCPDGDEMLAVWLLGYNEKHLMLGGFNMEDYRQYLQREEKSPLTVEKYLRDVKKFQEWLGERPLNKGNTLAYKAMLAEQYAVSSVNSMLSALNSWLDYMGRSECRVKFIKQQRNMFSSAERELTKTEYERLLKAARSKPRLHLLLQTICSTGIRVSEHRFITVEAAKRGSARVQLKGKVRVVLLPRELCRSLLRYAKERGLHSGSIFVTANGRPMDRSSIWAEMKKLCAAARVAKEKVFPHNLRHLFARTYYSLEKDVVRLADILGHSNVNTTRIYTMESGTVHRRQIEKMQLCHIM